MILILGTCLSTCIVITLRLSLNRLVQALRATVVDPRFSTCRNVPMPVLDDMVTSVVAR